MYISDLVLPCVTENVLIMGNRADPGETPRFVASHLGLHYL